MKYHYILSIITMFLWIGTTQAQENTCATATPLTEGTFTGTLGINGAPNYDMKPKYFSYTPSVDEKWLFKIQGTRTYNSSISNYIPTGLNIESGTCASKTSVKSIYEPTKDSSFVEYTLKANTSYIFTVTSTNLYKFSATKSANNCTTPTNVKTKTTTSTATFSFNMPNSTIAWSYGYLPKGSVVTPTYTLSISTVLNLASLTANTEYELYILPYNCTTPFKFPFKTVGCKYPTGLKLDSTTSKYAVFSMDSSATQTGSDAWHFGFLKATVSGSPSVAGTTTTNKFTVTGLEPTTQYIVFARNNVCTTWSGTNAVTFTTKHPCDLYPAPVNYATSFSTGKTKIITNLNWSKREALSWNYKILNTQAELNTAIQYNVVPTAAATLASVNVDSLSLNKVYYIAIQPVCADKSGDWKITKIDQTQFAVANDRCKDAVEIGSFPFSASSTLGYTVVDKPSSCSNFFQVTDLGDRFYKFKAASTGTLSATVSSSTTPILGVGYYSGTCANAVKSCNMVQSAFTPNGTISISNVEIKKDSVYYILAYASEYGVTPTPETTIEINIQSDVQILGLKDQKVSRGIQVSPNPFTNDLTVDLSGIAKPLSIQLVDAMGNLVLNQNIDQASNLQNLACQGLQSGMYVMKIVTETGLVVDKVIKE